MSKAKQSLSEIQEKKRELEYEEHRVKTELKQLTIHHHRALIEECVEDLMETQEKNGKLEPMDIQLHLQELTTKIRGLYDK